MAEQVQGLESASDGSSNTVHAGVFVERLVLRNFRGISECTLTLEPSLTLLVGRNNAGKSRLLRASAIALGALPPDRDDLTIGGFGDCSIDIVLAPRFRENGAEKFDDRVLRRLIEVQLINENPERERFSWRTMLRPSREGFGVRSESYVMTFDTNDQSWTPTSTRLTAEQSSSVSAALIETRRDFVEELTRRGSAIRRILDDLEVPAAQRTALEAELTQLGDKIITSSGSLHAVTGALQRLTASVSHLGTPHLSALPPRLEELSRSVSIDFDTGTGRLPVRLQGSGSRSLASLQVQGVLYDRRLGQDRGQLRPHPVSLIEEPEAHLHPQAQFELSDVLTGLTGQVVVTTHSSHLVAEADPSSLRVLRPYAAGLSIVDFSPRGEDDPVRARRPRFHPDEMEKLRRTVERPFGELLFASFVVIGDGATERALLPPLIRHALELHARGICVIDPGSMAGPSATAAVKFAKFMDLPWLLFSDADKLGVAAAKKLDADWGAGDEKTIVWVGRPGSDVATEQMLVDFDAEVCRAGVYSGRRRRHRFSRR